MSGWGNDREGFSLLEAVVGLAIVGVAATAMLTTLAAELRAASRARHALESHALAEARLASMRLLVREDLQPLADSLRRGRFGAPFAAYGWEAASRQLAGQPDLFEIRVTIRSDDTEYAVSTRLYRPRSLGRGR